MEITIPEHMAKNLQIKYCENNPEQELLNTSTV